MTTIERILARIEQDPNGGCWLWSGAISDFGHGVINVAGKILRTHRVMWEEHNGTATPGMDIMHKCDVPACCNPAHLSQGTRQDNVQDMLKKGRGNAPKGEKSHKTKLTERDARELKAALAAGVKQKVLAEKYGIRPQSVSLINIGRNWSHI